MTKEIEVIGLGAGDIEQLPLGVYRKLLATDKQIYARTANHPVVQSLINEGISLQSFDYVYQDEISFAVLYENIVKELLEKMTSEDIIYVVPGHPMLAEKTVQLLLEIKDVTVTINGGQSYLDDMFTALQIDPIDGFQFLDATSFSREDINYRQHVIFCQVYDSLIAADLKITLLEDLPHNYEITVVEAVGTASEQLINIPLEDLDRTVAVSNLTSVYIPPVQDKQLLYHQFVALRDVIRELRGPDGCPWDKQQTHESLRKYAIEEVYELIDAIDRKDDDAIIEELGDVLLQVMLHSQIGEDNGYFSIDDVIRSIVTKMIHRHPHVFAEDSKHKSWDDLKKEERNDKKRESLLDSVVIHGPALHVAEQLQHTVAKVRFDWDNVLDVWDKLQEEFDEFYDAVEQNSTDKIEEEFGDILFVLANIARFYHMNPELILRKANMKFKRRFNALERLAKERGIILEKTKLKKLNKLWNEVKQKE